MIKFSNGHLIEYLTASGAMAYDGFGWPWEKPLRWLGFIDPMLFTHVTKTLTYAPRQGNLRWSHPWSCVNFLSHGVVNAIGLTNPGYRWWLKKVAPKLGQRPPLICSITEDNPQKLIEMVQALNSVPIKAIEFNASCPNTDQELLANTEKVVSLVETLKQHSRHPLILKLSYTQDYRQLAQKTETLVEALAINSVPWKVVFPAQKSPLERLGGGGVSGKAARTYTWKMVEELAVASKTPVIGPGIWDYEDLQALRKLGAQALSFGSIFVKHPTRPTAFVRKDLSELSAEEQ